MFLLMCTLYSLVWSAVSAHFVLVYHAVELVGCMIDQWVITVFFFAKLV